MRRIYYNMNCHFSLTIGTDEISVYKCVQQYQWCFVLKHKFAQNESSEKHPN